MSMKALKFYGKQDIRLETVAIPEPQQGEARIRITAASICATDIERWQHGFGEARSRRSDAKTVGHESAGQVEALGAKTSGLNVGDRVMVNNVMPCGDCFWCTRGMHATCRNGVNAGFSVDGGLANYMTWPVSQLIKLPDSVQDYEAPLIEPTTVAVHAAHRSGVRAGDTVAVIGCGAVGLLTLQAFCAAVARGLPPMCGLKV